jgi:hypothetical protein
MFMKECVILLALPLLVTIATLRAQHAVWKDGAFTA